ncbi:hypothetical protein AUK45_03515 [Candidatus Peregrinibacteria bacterium CG2_30_44_17]|nr:MAG: hypothetical protein AUK45_03515 [Candidatus Peregrinibacteria bacterium CG2_30_44_17]
MNPSQCKTCSQPFLVTNEDKAFYAKLNLPQPSACPQCRSRRRLAYRNEQNLYKRKCDLCSKKIVSIYSEDKPYPVYCQKCFWGDSWDPLEYGKSFDKEKPFSDQFEELMAKAPRLAIVNKQSENSDYCNYSFANKNCYLTFGNHYEEDCMYGHYSTKNSSCMDYLQLYKSELCYGCVFTKNSYRSIYLGHCDNCQECLFSVDLKGCKNCLFCSNLRHKEFHILNEPYSKEEYFKKLKEYEFSNYDNFEKAANFYEGEFRTKFPVRSVYQSNCENCQGSNLENSRNMRYCFDCAECEDCAYGFQMDESYDCMDSNCMGYDRSEVCYQTIGCSGITSCIACDSCWHGNDLHYCNLCFSSKNLFGCIGLNKKQYCILNKQYTKEEYETLMPQIIEQMKKEGVWGEFFRISPFTYGESVAQEYFYIHEEAITKSSEKADDAETCIQCSKNFRIVEKERGFYKELNLPEPRKCPACRHNDRITRRNPRALWQRTCSKCSSDTWTSYAPDRSEKIYCEKCYLEEVY